MQRRTSGSALFVLAAVSTACSSGGDLPSAPHEPVDGAPFEPDAAREAGALPIDASIGMSTDFDGRLPLPFAVDDRFAPSGFMGEGVPPTSAVSVATTDCAARELGAQGRCYRFRYEPVTPGLDSSWAGVFWQYPDNNWGTQPGMPIESGASEVSFYAWGATGGERIRFLVGGVGTNQPVEHRDTLALERTITLSAELRRYVVDLSGHDYDRVIGGFGWVISAPPGRVEFYIDDIRWQ